MQTGTKISLMGHGLLVSWAVFGAWFPSEPLPLPVQEVSLISADEFERLSQQRLGPVLQPDASGPVAPEIAPEQTALPDTPSPAEPIQRPPDVRPDPPEPEVAVTTSPDPLPSIPDITPEAQLPEDTAAVVPALPEPAQQRPSDRVAPVRVAPPAPETAVDDVVREEVSPEDGAEDSQPVQEATAPEAASDRIVTEENEGEDQAQSAPDVAAPIQSLRPRRRPSRSDPVPEPNPEPQEERRQVESAAVEDALAAAIAGGADVEAPEPSGPPLTAGEKDGLRVAVSQCWNVGSLSSEALRVTVVVNVAMLPDGKPDAGSIRLLSSTGGSGGAAQQAYQAARRAIIRCGARGFNLPADKYDHWRDIEMTFNPERMRIK